MDIEEILDSQSKMKLRRIEKDLPNIREDLGRIYQGYDRSELEPFMKELKNMLGGQCYIYQISPRIKAPDSLVKKIIKKLYEGKRLYCHINADNYNKIVTDLIGLRIIHKFPDEWKNINKLLYDLFDQGEDKYISNYLTEYTNDNQRPFLVEKPTIYYLPDEDLGMYKEVEKKEDRSLFVFKPRENYRSVHYLINFKGIYTEIQVRTLSDELWGEIDHDFVYKQEISTRKDKLSESAGILRDILSASDDLSMYMKKVNDNQEDAAEQYWILCRKKIENTVKMLNRKG